MTAASASTMPRVAKLTSPADFRRAYAEGSRSGSGAVVAHVRRSDSQNAPRLGVTTVKGFGGAVARNRARRRLREAARTLEPRLRADVDAVLVATPRADRVSFQDLVISVEAALSHAGALRE